MPADAVSEVALAARLITAAADPAGIYTSPTLPPGKYLAAATSVTFDHTEESIQKLWQSKLKFTEVTIPPAGQVQVKLAPLD